MRSLKEYAEEFHGQQHYSLYKSPTDYCNSLYSFMENNGFDDETLTEDAAQWYFDEYWNGHENDNRHVESLTRRCVWINEMLKSHDVKFVIKELNKTFYDKYKKNISFVKEESTRSKNKAAKIKVPVELCKDKKSFEEMIKICDKFMWVLTSRYVNLLDDADEDGYKIVELEPIEGEICTDYIKEKCNSLIYHVTLRRHASKIDRSGLRCKGEDRIQRFYTNRIYFVTGTTKQEILKGIDIIRKSLEIDEEDMLVYRIDISNMNIDFYRDPYDYPNCDAVYTFANIPKKFLRGSYRANELKNMI